MSHCHIITGPRLDSSQSNLLKPMSQCDVFIASEQLKMIFGTQDITCHWESGPIIKQ